MPSIASSNPASNMVFITGTISLSCISDSVPVSVITWFHEGSLLTNGAGGAIINSAGGSSTLIRSGLTTTSGGTYTCVATNEVGSANASVEVIIQGKPPPHTPSHHMHTPPHISHHISHTPHITHSHLTHPHISHTLTYHTSHTHTHTHSPPFSPH